MVKDFPPWTAGGKKNSRQPLDLSAMGRSPRKDFSLASLIVLVGLSVRRV